MSDKDSNLSRLIASKPGKNDKYNYSFYVDRKNYKRLLAVCKKLGISASAAVDAMIADFVEKYGGK